MKNDHSVEQCRIRATAYVHVRDVGTVLCIRKTPTEKISFDLDRAFNRYLVASGGKGHPENIRFRDIPSCIRCNEFISHIGRKVNSPDGFSSRCRWTD